MTHRFVVSIHEIDQDEKTINKKDIMIKEILDAKSIAELGLNRQEILDVIHKMEKWYLNAQGVYLNHRPEGCCNCGAHVWSNGSSESNFESTFSSHKISLTAWSCSNQMCKWSNTPSVKSKFGNSCHPELVQMQVEAGTKNSYRKAADSLNSLTGKRTINNHSRIQRMTKSAGTILEEFKAKNAKNDTKISIDKPALELIAAVDGGYVHDKEEKGKNFEAMIGKIYKPENVVRIDKHHTKITEKHCTGSAKYDEQSTMIRNFKESAEREGITKNTTIIGLADGASNCWNVIKSLSAYCMALICILDWFHIGKYITNVTKQLPQYESTFESVRQLLWIGDSDKAISLLLNLLDNVSGEKDHKIMFNFYHYICDNKEMLINYEERKANGMVYTSHVAESTVEHFLNARARKKQKMQWSRDGLHAVLLLRGSLISGDWGYDWNNVILPEFTKAA